MPEDFAQGLLAGSVYQGNDMTMKSNPSIIFALALFFGILIDAVAQERPVRVGGSPMIEADNQTKFDLNFKGGTPKQFIEAINAQSGLKVNVIIPNEEANAQLPAIEVFGVTVPRLFQALTQASRKETNVITGSYYNYNYIPNAPKALAMPQFTRQWISQGFRTSDNPTSEDSIWHFYIERPIPPPEMAVDVRVTVQVYQLAHLLKDHSIDDVTTAIKTTWQMLDSSVTPELKYHSDTGLLIAKGTEEQLRIVMEVLNQLRLGKNQTGDLLPPLPPTELQP